MRNSLFPILLIGLLSACDESSILPPERDDAAPPATEETAPVNNNPPPVNNTPTPAEPTPNVPAPVTSGLNIQIATALADGYCKYQKQFQILSTSLQSAYAPKGNGHQINTCGGENNFSDDGFNFEFHFNDYCVNARGEQVILNGDITGMLDAGGNFISEIPGITLVGDSIDAKITGNTWDGRADDNHMNLQVTDYISGEEITLENLSIKKGEFDFGDVTFPGQASYYFQVIKQFNADNTEGFLFFFGEGDQRVIVSGDQGMITGVYKENKKDQGTWLDLPCNE